MFKNIPGTKVTPINVQEIGGTLVLMRVLENPNES